MTLEEEKKLYDLNRRLPVYRAWQLVFTPIQSTILGLTEVAFLDQDTRLSPASFTTSRNNNGGVPASFLNDSSTSGWVEYSGSAPLAITAEFAQPHHVSQVQVHVPQTNLAAIHHGALLQGGEIVGGQFKVKQTQSLRALALPPESGNQLCLFTPAEFSVIEPLQSDLDYMTPGGNGRIGFYVTTEYFPAPGFPTYLPQHARVQLHRLNDGRVVQTKWSDEVTGRGWFENVDPAYAYAITATHPTHSYQALIASNIRPEIVPEY